MATTRERLHEMLDDLPDDLLDDAEAAIASIASLVVLTHRPLLAAPDDDEPLTDEELTAIREGSAEYERGELIPHDQAMRSIGL